jgi:hypothetical protein
MLFIFSKCIIKEVVSIGSIAYCFQLPLKDSLSKGVVPNRRICSYFSAQQFIIKMGIVIKQQAADGLFRSLQQIRRSHNR